MVSDNEFIYICESSNSMAEAASKLGLHFNTFKRRAIQLNCYKPNQGCKGTTKQNIDKRKETLDLILSGKYPHYQTYKLKQLLFMFNVKENKCECCGISEWQGKPLNYELHHIDGNRTNHELSNLMMLCPNCHSQTENFRSLNIKSFE